MSSSVVLVQPCNLYPTPFHMASTVFAAATMEAACFDACWEQASPVSHQGQQLPRWLQKTEEEAVYVVEIQVGGRSKHVV